MIISLLTLAASTATFAQDAGMSDVEISTDHDLMEGEKSTYVPGEEVRYIPKASGIATVKDSVSLVTPPMPPGLRRSEKPGDRQPAKQKDDSILTYNFLYYIIQKYKLQDIID